MKHASIKMIIPAGSFQNEDTPIIVNNYLIY